MAFLLAKANERLPFATDYGAQHGRDEITSLGKQYLRGLYDLYGKRPGSGQPYRVFHDQLGPLATSDLFTQPTSDWYIKQGIDKKDEAYQEAASHLDMDLIQYRLSPDDQTLTAIYTTPQYLSQEAREKIEPYLIEPKVYTWQKYHFQ